MFWTVLIIHYSMETLGITTLTHIAYSTEKKCSQAMKPMLKVVLTLGRNVNSGVNEIGRAIYGNLTLGRNVNQHQHQRQ
jgi:hypothetical protein